MSGGVEAPAARAQTLIDLDRHAEAVPLLLQALASEPEDVWLLDLLAQAQLHVDADAALATAHRLIAVSPDDHRGHVLAALASRRASSGREAERHARQAVELAPHSPNAHVVLAQTLVDRKRKLREAMRHAEQAVELAPHEAMGYVTAGNVELRRGHGRKADAWYRRALDVSPANATAAANLALTHSVRGRPADALAEASALLRVDPQDEWAREVLERAVYTTLVHLQWVALIVAAIAAIARVG